LTNWNGNLGGVTAAGKKGRDFLTDAIKSEGCANGGDRAGTLEAEDV
jgi:hypothetical protein